MKRLIDDLIELGVGCGAIILAWAIIAVVVGFPIKWLWNWLMPNLFGLPEISFWMALGIALLISILFGGVIKINKN
jgi:hypothetical protein